ncbi:ATP-binding protein [Ramlibacter sp. Leaf400]|uniref:ATP-binding protein n=1 Tax=Ramlibacter sp. Leaf400 TaxID=1736365 RepID=UPI0006F31049|nr:ATP-binding protein [Ramlibacter sp. Leaf400]KQT10210.1 hypothetical protein ASG30_10150 [Ramlibacter sp. Leaf400]
MKPSERRSIRSKLNSILATTTLVALVVAAIALLVVDLRRELADINEDLLTQADVIALATAPALAFADVRVATENLAVLRAKQAVVAAALYDESGALFAIYRRPEAGGFDIPQRPQAFGVTVEGDWASAWRPVVLNRERVGTVWLQMRHERLRQTFEYLGVLAVIMGGSLAAALLLSNRLQRSLTSPILGISEVARKILRGETGDLRATRSSDDEVGELVDAFNAMLDELQRRSQTLEGANQALRSSEARYQLAVRGSSAGLWDWDMPGGTMFYSPRFKALLGYTDEEFPDKPSSIRDVLHPDDWPAVAATLRAHLRERAPYQVECRLRDRAGHWRWFFVAGAALWDPAGQPFRMAGSVVEVTERKEAERVLQEANRAKDEFLATLAHELRNPLAPIRTGLEILKKDTANGAPSQIARATMERQLAHMIRLIDDLLDISRINSGKIRLEVSRVRLRPALDSAVEISRPAVASGGHSLSVEMPEDEIEVMGDPTRLAQALGNLLNNAAKYTPPGGRIALRARREGEFALIEVEDNGEGIPREMLDTIFSLFSQVRSTLDRAQGGLGIGLYLVRSLIELHGGTVVAESAGPGLGSRFIVRLPCLAATAHPLPQLAPAALGLPQGGVKVLLVDDNVDAAETLSLVLEMAGCTTHVLHEGTQVVAAAHGFGPDVILLDIGLPGMSGYEVAQRLRQEPRFARTLLVAITGWGTEQDRRRSQESGFDQHLTKPVDFSALEPLLHQAVAGRAAATVR